MTKKFLSTYDDKYRTQWCSTGIVSEIFVTGGTIGRTMEATAYRYTISLDKWSSMQPMQNKRRLHSSCMHGNNIFVIGGLGCNEEPLGSIERCIVTNNSNVWVSIEVDPSVLTPRIMPIVS